MQFTSTIAPVSWSLPAEMDEFQETGVVMEATLSDLHCLSSGGKSSRDLSTQCPVMTLHSRSQSTAAGRLPM